MTDAPDNPAAIPVNVELLRAAKELLALFEAIDGGENDNCRQFVQMRRAIERAEAALGEAP